jgi:iron complex transport system permease protein
LQSKKWYIIIAFVVVGVLFFAGLFLGSEWLTPSQVCEGLFQESRLNFIVLDLRLPRVLTAILSGAALSVSGLLMQTYFRNALAGPYILGVSAGGGLGVALLLMAGFLFSFNISEIPNLSILFSISGSALILFLVMLLSKKIGNGSMLLIAGLMLGSFVSAIIAVLQYFAPSESIKKYLLWTMGSLSSVDLSSLIGFSIIVMVFIVLAMLMANPLNAVLMGSQQAQNLGVNVRTVKWFVMLCSGVLAGLVTAYCGPIAFIGLAAPHLSRLILKSHNHHHLILFSALMGAIVLLFCDIVAQLPGMDLQLPINVVTSIVGAPLVIYIIIKSKFSTHV